MTQPNTSRPRFSLARKKARELLDQIGPFSPPIPIETVAASIGARITFEPFDGEMSGMVLKSGDGSAVLGINSRHPNVRRRFSIAHELGHLVLHGEETLHVDAATPFAYRTGLSSEGTDPQEVEANQFAAELLMPEQLVKRDFQELMSLHAEDAVEKLAEQYEVSTQAMTLRLHRLALIH